MVKVGRRAARVSFSKTVAAMFSGASAILVAAAPSHILGSATQALSLPGFFQTPLILAPIAAIIVGGISWVLLRPLELRLGWAKRTGDYEDGGYADVDLESPLANRRPIFATDELGAPLMSDEVLDREWSEPEPEPTIMPAFVNPVIHNAASVDAPPVPEVSETITVYDPPELDRVDDVLELGPTFVAPLPDRDELVDEAMIAAPISSEAVTVPIDVDVNQDESADYLIAHQNYERLSIAELIQRLEEGLVRRAQLSEGLRSDSQESPTQPRQSAWLMNGEENASHDVVYSDARPDDVMRERLNALRHQLGR